MAKKAKHAFGSLSEVQNALKAGKINEFDILFLDGDTSPKIGWIDRNGIFRLVENESDFSELESIIKTKADVADVEALEAKVESKASTEDLAEVDAKIAKKIDATEVDSKINTAVADSVGSANAYTDKMIEAAMDEHLVKKYEITSVPDGTLVDYRDKEIRVMVPADTKWVKQNVGSAGNANMVYMAFKAYAPDGAVSFKEGDRGVIIDEMFTFDSDFAGTDEYGRNYSICWLALASYDASSDTWTYFGKNSSIEKFVGWDYIVEWYNENGVVIASDCVRINLSNEGCHSTIEPYYVSAVRTETKSYVDTVVEEKVSEVYAAYEVIEF